MNSSFPRVRATHARPRVKEFCRASTFSAIFSQKNIFKIFLNAAKLLKVPLFRRTVHGTVHRKRTLFAQFTAVNSYFSKFFLRKKVENVRSEGLIQIYYLFSQK
jgi:hypothetical protein